MDSKYRNRRTGGSGQQVDQADRCEHLTGSASGFVDTSSFVAFAIFALAFLSLIILRWCIRWQKGHLLGHLLPFTCSPHLRVAREAWLGHMGTWSHWDATWAHGPLGHEGHSHSRHPRHFIHSGWWGPSWWGPSWGPSWVIFSRWNLKEQSHFCPSIIIIKQRLYLLYPCDFITYRALLLVWLINYGWLYEISEIRGEVCSTFNTLIGRH